MCHIRKESLFKKRSNLVKQHYTEYMMEKVIIAVLILLIVGLLLTTERVRAICCDAIKKEVENKMEANQTLCSHRNQYQKALPENCCKDIASEVEKYVAAYETLCAGKYVREN